MRLVVRLATGAALTHLRKQDAGHFGLFSSSRVSSRSPELSRRWRAWPPWASLPQTPPMPPTLLHTRHGEARNVCHSFGPACGQGLAASDEVTAAEDQSRIAFLLWLATCHHVLWKLLKLQPETQHGT